MKNEEFTFNLDEELKNELLYQELESELISSKKETLKTNTNKPKQRKNKTKYVKKLKKGLSIKTVLLLLVTLIMNTYAWFIYISTVTASITMHIKNWDIQFSDNVIDESFNFNIERIYPGMTDAEQTITIQNNGETDGKLQCVITYFKIFEESYDIETEYDDGSGGTFRYTSEELLDMIKSYPFAISLDVNGTEYVAGTEVPLGTSETATVSFTVSWPYETGSNEDEISENDEIDTFWGEKAYSYTYGTGEYAIEISMRLEVIQDV